jgi:hypothetical protein
MSVRARGLAIAAGSALAGAILYWLLFHALAESTRSVRIRVYPLALPLVGVFWGLIELIGGVPFSQLQAKWDTLPEPRQRSLGCLLTFAGGVMVLGLLYLLSMFL